MKQEGGAPLARETKTRDDAGRTRGSTSGYLRRTTIAVRRTRTAGIEATVHVGEASSATVASRDTAPASAAVPRPGGASLRPRTTHHLAPSTRPTRPFWSHLPLCVALRRSTLRFSRARVRSSERHAGGGRDGGGGRDDDASSRVREKERAARRRARAPPPAPPPETCAVSRVAGERADGERRRGAFASARSVGTACQRGAALSQGLAASSSSSSSRRRAAKASQNARGRAPRHRETTGAAAWSSPGAGASTKAPSPAASPPKATTARAVLRGKARVAATQGTRRWATATSTASRAHRGSLGCQNLGGRSARRWPTV